MEILCGSDLSLSAMRTAGSRAMNHGRRIIAMQGEQRLARFENSNTPARDFWPEVSSRHSPDELAQAASENSPGRVLFEVFLVLGVAGLTAVVAILWLPILS
jgi:hypothetical protein